MATNPPSFFNPESISYDQYSKGPVDFYNQALDVSSLTGTGVDIVNPDDITKLKDYGIAGGGDDGGDTQDDALNALDATSMQGDFVGGSMFPGGTGIEYNNFNAYDKYESYSDYITGEKPPGMADRVNFISNVMEPLTSGRFGDIDFTAGTEGLADRVGKGLTDKSNVGKTIATTAAGIPGALVGSVVLSTDTVRNAFGNTSARPSGILGMFADAVHATQYADMAHNRAVARANMTDFRESVSGMTEDRFQDDSLAGRFAADRDIGFSMQFGSGTGAGGITRKAGTFTYTGNMRGLDNRTLKNIEAVQRGFVPSTFGRSNFGFDYTGKGATTFEEAGYSGEVAGGGRYTNTGAFMDAYGRTSMMGSAKHSASLAAQHGLSVTEIGSILSNTRKGNGNLMDNIKAAKADKAAKAQAELDRQAAADRAKADQALRDRYGSGVVTSEDSGGDYGVGGGGGDFDAGSGGRGGSDYGTDDGGDYDDSFATGGKVQGYAMGTPPPGVQASQTGFVDRPPSQVPEDQKVADDVPDSVPEGTYVLNAAAVEFAGEKDIRKMIMDAQKEAVRRGLSKGDTQRSSDLVDIAVSRGEVKIAPHLVKIIGEDRLEKINKRGLRKTEERIEANGQEPVAVSGGGFISRKKFKEGGMSLPKSKPKRVNQSGLADVELRADLEEYIQNDPLARLAFNLYEKGDVDVKAIIPHPRGKVGVGGLYTPIEDMDKPGRLHRGFERKARRQGITKFKEDVPRINYFVGESKNFSRETGNLVLLHELRHHAMRHLNKKYKVPLPELGREETLMDVQDYANRIQARKVKPSIPEEQKEKGAFLRKRGAYMSPSANKELAMYQEIAKEVLKDRKVPKRTKSKEVEGFFTRAMGILGL